MRSDPTWWHGDTDQVNSIKQNTVLEHAIKGLNTVHEHAIKGLSHEHAIKGLIHEHSIKGLNTVNEHAIEGLNIHRWWQTGRISTRKGHTMLCFSSNTPLSVSVCVLVFQVWTKWIFKDALHTTHIIIILKGVAKLSNLCVWPCQLHRSTYVENCKVSHLAPPYSWKKLLLSCSWITISSTPTESCIPLPSLRHGSNRKNTYFACILVLWNDYFMNLIRVLPVVY